MKREVNLIVALVVAYFLILVSILIIPPLERLSYPATDESEYFTITNGSTVATDIEINIGKWQTDEIPSDKQSTTPTPPNISLYKEPTATVPFYPPVVIASLERGADNGWLCPNCGYNNGTVVSYLLSDPPIKEYYCRNCYRRYWIEK